MKRKQKGKSSKWYNMSEEIEKANENNTKEIEGNEDIRKKRIFRLITVKNGKFVCYLFWIKKQIFDLENDGKLKLKSSRINLNEFPYINYKMHSNSISNYRQFLKSNSLVVDGKGNSYALSEYFISFLKEEAEFIDQEAFNIMSKIIKENKNGE